MTASHLQKNEWEETAPEVRVEPGPPPANRRRDEPGMLRGTWDWLAAYFVGDDPTFWVAMVPMLIFAALLFTRHLSSNYIFDEQEALLANPYVNGKSLTFIDAVHRDFWGLPPDRSVGSYRPLPNYVWRGVWDAQQWVTGGVNATLVGLKPAVAAVASPRAWTGWVAWPNLLALLFGLPSAIGLAWAAAKERTLPARIAAAVASVAIMAGIAGSGPNALWTFVGAGLVVLIVALTMPIWGVAAAVLPALLLTGLAHLPTNAMPPVMQPWLFHWLNVLFHAANGALIVCIVFALTKRRGPAWIAGVVFVSAAVLTEAVSGVVGIADVMGGMGACLALLALRLPMWGMPFAVLVGVVFGLFSKESALVCVPLVPFAAVVLAPLTHPRRPWRWARGLLALTATVLALVLYVELRKRWFPAPMPAELEQPLPETANIAAKGMHWFRGWFHQGPLPRDPLNNPLVDADFPHRVAGALRVFWRGLVQVAFPRELSGDYSYPQEPAPTTLHEPEGILGGIAILGLPIASLVMWVWSWVRERRVCRDLITSTGQKRKRLSDELIRSRMPSLAMLGSVGLMWIVVSYFPHSNIPVLLPTVRAERFWYFPVIGSSLAITAGFVWLFRKTRHWHQGAVAVGLVAAFITFQAARARTHAFHYADDLTFWDATRKAVPNSSKAHLNYSVMWGARGRLDIRLYSNRDALRLAPKWAMAHIYLGDTLCRLHRPDEAWPYYRDGFELAPGDPNLIALALQCMWDEVSIEDHEDDLLTMGTKHPGSWLEYLAKDTISNGTKNSGVDPKYRPRGYNEGPKE